MPVEIVILIVLVLVATVVIGIRPMIRLSAAIVALVCLVVFWPVIYWSLFPSESDRLTGDLNSCSSSSAEIALAACSRYISHSSFRSANSGIQADSFYYRGRAYAALGDTERAIADYDAALRLRPDDAGAFNGRGLAHAANRNADRAIADYTQTLRLNPDSAEAFNNRGLAYAAKGDYGRAIADYTKAIGLNFAEAFNNRGLAYAAKGDYGRAIADYDEALRATPDDAEPFINRGLAYAAKGDRERGIAPKGDARLQPDYAIAYVKRAGKLSARGDYTKAREAYEEALRLDPRNSAAQEGLGKAGAKLAEVGQPGARVEPPEAPRPAAPAPASADLGRRVALVIGNGAYTEAGRLANALNDARAITAALARLGFDVTSAMDLSSNRFGAAVASFTAKARGADVALFFYAGHAFQIGPTNYLMPVDARLANEFDAKREAISAQDIVEHMENAARINIVFLDACRKNPVADRLRSTLLASGRAGESGRGLARINARGRDTLIVFSAEPGEEALDADGSGQHSPFTAGLLQNIERPGLEIEVMLKLVTKAVGDATKGKQRPERLSKLESVFYFKP